MNPFVSKINRGSWEIPVSALCLVLGIMISLVLIKPENRPSRELGAAQKDRLASVVDTDVQEANVKLNAQVIHLQGENTRLQNAMASETTQGKVLNQSLQDVKLFAGLTDVEGPGITVTLRDSTKQPSADESKAAEMADNLNSIIHDDDVLRVVNELWASGAEAISINNHRVSIGTSVRCVGPTILVDGSRIASPVAIRAIGDPDSLEGALTMPGGVLDELKQQDPAMVQVEKEKKNVLPAYTGSTEHALETVPKESK